MENTVKTIIESKVKTRKVMTKEGKAYIRVNNRKYELVKDVEVFFEIDTRKNYVIIEDEKYYLIMY